MRGGGDEWYYYPGGPFRPWGGPDTILMAEHPTSPFRGSSYGMNGWLGAGAHRPPNGPRQTAFGPPFELPVKESSRVPLFADAMDSLGFPAHTDAPPQGLSPYAPPPLVYGQPVYGMGRVFCIPRHGRAINVVFVDGHARTVPLAELWQLKWGPAYEPTAVTLPP